MKNLFILLAFFIALCYAGRSFSETAWETCARQEMVVEFSKPAPQFLQDLCKFYDKPMVECTEIMQKSTDAQIKTIVNQYLLHSVFIPKCGQPE